MDLMSTDGDVCSLQQPFFQCPVKKGPLDLEQALPISAIHASMIPDGDYSLKLVLKDDEKEEVACLLADMQLQQQNSTHQQQQSAQQQQQQQPPAQQQQQPPAQQQQQPPA